MDTLLDRALTLLKGQVGVARAVAGWAQNACEQALTGQQTSSPSPLAPVRSTASTTAESEVRAAATRDHSSRASDAVTATSAHTETAASAAEHLGIAGYDQLAASQIVARLDTLSPDQRAEIGDYERSRRRRRTILHRIAQLESD